MIRFLALLTVFVSALAFAEPDDFIADFLAGSYILIGKSMDSNETYTGHVEISTHDGALKIRRVVDGKVTVGNGAIESALNGETSVLRIRFVEDEGQFEKTCLWRGDLNNHARISCYLYRTGEDTLNPGLEALFHDHARR